VSPPARRSARLPAGPALLAAILVLDQVTKAAILRHLPTSGWVEVTPFMNLVLVWNPGISFGLLGGALAGSPWPLVALTLAIAALLVAWLARERRTLPRLAIWAILAGALGNLIDRVRYGAVVDFLDLHVAGYHWPAFNVADSAIVVGACALVLDGLVLSRGAAPRVEEKG
jgi:signal peptidase II